MANLPVESMKTGGLAWFTDLTVSDPYFALPVMTVLMLYVTIEVKLISPSCICCLRSVIAFLKCVDVKCSVRQATVISHCQFDGSMCMWR